MPILLHIKRFSLATLILLLASRSWAGPTMKARYEQIKQGLTSTLPGTNIAISSVEGDERLNAETTSILPHPYEQVSRALDNAANWCLLMPLHFNIKACTHEEDSAGTVLQIYSGRKHYQAPGDSYRMNYRFKTQHHDDQQLQIHLNATRGPANTRDYRIEISAIPVEEGTLLHIRSSYRPSLLSSVLVGGYLSTLGRNKIGFSRDNGSISGEYVKGIRGVIERNVMRYNLAIGAFLASNDPSGEPNYQAMLPYWFNQNDSYPEQLHEMSRVEYIEIKQKELKNQKMLQQTINERSRLVVMHTNKSDG